MAILLTCDRLMSALYIYVCYPLHHDVYTRVRSRINVYQEAKACNYAP